MKKLFLYILVKPALIILLFISVMFIAFLQYKNIKIKNKYTESQKEYYSFWLASGEAMKYLLKDKRINIAINGNLKNVQNQNDLISIYNKNIDSFKNKMNALNVISIKKRNVKLSETEWKLVFFSVLLNQSYHYGATSAYLHLTPGKIIQSLPQINSLHCGNLGDAVYSIVQNIADVKLKRISYLEHSIYIYGKTDEVLLLDPTFNIYGIVSKKGLSGNPLNNSNTVEDFIFLENKNNTLTTGLRWHDDLNKFQASVLYYIGGSTVAEEGEVVGQKGLNSDEELKTPGYDLSYKVYNIERERKINY